MVLYRRRAIFQDRINLTQTRRKLILVEEIEKKKGRKI